MIYWYGQFRKIFLLFPANENTNITECLLSAIHYFKSSNGSSLWYVIIILISLMRKKWVLGKFNNILSWDFNLKETWKFFQLSHEIIMAKSCYDYRSDAICNLFHAHAWQSYVKDPDPHLSDQSVSSSRL